MCEIEIELQVIKAVDFLINIIILLRWILEEAKSYQNS